MAINKDRTVSTYVHTMIDNNSRIVVPRPSCIYCRPVAHLTNNIPIVVGIGTRGSFGMAPSRLGTTVASGAGLLVLPCPYGPANTVVRERSLRGLCRIVGSGGVLILSSRVCDRLAFNNGTRVSPTSVSNVGSQAIVMGNFSGTFSVAN